jgi:hypothetical protein
MQSPLQVLASHQWDEADDDFGDYLLIQSEPALQ